MGSEDVKMQEKLEKRKHGNIFLDKEAVTATCYSIATAHKHPNLALICTDPGLDFVKANTCRSDPDQPAG